MYKDMLKPVHLAPAVVVGGTFFAIFMASFFSWGYWLLALVGVGALGVALLAFVQAFGRYQSLQVGFLGVVTLFTQVFAYGLGTWSGLWQWATGKKVASGFTKNYYK